jgi:DNA-binding MurR/RpiR family transcriptional regulator
VFVGINLWRYVREIVEGMRQAREQGVHTIAVTDSLISPLVQLADEAFVAMTDGVAQSRSPAALIALLEALVAAMSFKRPEQVVTNLRRVDEIYRSSNLVIDVWPSNEEIDH